MNENCQFNFEEISIGRVRGWAFVPGQPKLKIEAWSGGRCIAAGEAKRGRPDVARGFPTVTESGESGFILVLPDLIPGVHSLEFFAVSEVERKKLLSFEITRFAGSEIAAANMAAHAAPQLPAPFPGPVVAAVQTLQPNVKIDLGTDAGQEAFIDLLLSLLRNSDIAHVSALIRYVRFLRAVWRHMDFVDRYFPVRNTLPGSSAKDALCKGSSPYEMFSIAHHLYTLKSVGVSGCFAEFGCFKGFSSAMLSFACSLLNIQMLIFDSFEGLPPSDSKAYKAGEFAGSLGEVRVNVEEFGVISAVHFHKGFFSDSLRQVAVPPLMAIFMDVDLRSSAADVMTIARTLDPRGAIFSHECEPAHFNNGSVIPGALTPENVVPPIVDAFSGMDGPLAGRHVTATTGCFWRKDRGFPVACNSAVVKLATAL